MPLAIAVVWDVAKEPVKSKEYYDLIMKFEKITDLGLDREEKEEEVEYSDEVKELLETRRLARENKDFKTSDEIRDKLKDLGFLVIDSKEGQKLKKV